MLIVILPDKAVLGFQPSKLNRLSQYIELHPSQVHNTGKKILKEISTQ